MACRTVSSSSQLAQNICGLQSLCQHMSGINRRTSVAKLSFISLEQNMKSQMARLSGNVNAGYK